jgi:hypothetical protein
VAAPAAPAGPSAWKAEPVADPARLEALRAALAGKPAVAAALDAAAFQASDGTWMVPLQVSVAAAAATAADATLVGEVLDGQSGASVLQFQATRPWETSGDRKLIQQTLVLPAGDHTIQVGLVDAAGKVVWAGKDTVKVPGGEPGYWMSELVLSDNIFAMQDKQEMLEPFAWQGVAVVPKGDNTFAQGGPVWFYAHVCNPGLDPQGLPTLKTTLELKGPRRIRGPAKIDPVKAGESCWILAQALDLLPDQFPAGEYEIKMEITDTSSSKTLSSGGKFQVAAAGPAPKATG